MPTRRASQTLLRRLLSALALVLLTRDADVRTQPLAVLRIKVTIVDADHRLRPVPRHALLISDNPTSAAPRKTVTALDGSAEVRLPPGNYTVESDEPLIVQGKAYQWSRTLDVGGTGVTTLELTAENALVDTAVAGAASSASAVEGSVFTLLTEWQNSVVAIWSPTRLGAGVLIDARGLVVTNQRLVGKAASLEVQLSPTEKLSGRVLASDADRNIAILWVDPRAVAALRPVKLGTTAVAERDTLYAISASIVDDRRMSSGAVTRVNPRTIVADLRLDEESAGVPLFNAAGEAIAITVPEEDRSGGGSGVLRAVRVDEIRGVIAAAEKQMLKAEPPSSTRLPVDPQRPFGEEALRAAAERRTGSLAAYRVAAEDFDVSLMTPVLLYGARHQGDRVTGRERGQEPRNPAQMQPALRALEDFANWSDYVRDDPPVLMIRATPKLVEGIWTTIGRAAAQTQGVSLPPIKHIKAGFSRLRAYCGDVEVLPIHPFKIEQRVGDGDAVYEGLYVFDHGALGPQCTTVTLTFFSDKNPDKGDARIVDPKVIQQIWQDFDPYRVAAPKH